MSCSTLSFVFVFLAYLFMKFRHETALSVLDDAQKARLLDGFSTYRKFGILFLIAGIAFGFFVLSSLLEDSKLRSVLIQALTPSVLLIYVWRIDQRLRAIEMPREYMTPWRQGLGVFFLGIIGLAFCAFGF